MNISIFTKKLKLILSEKKLNRLGKETKFTHRERKVITFQSVRTMICVKHFQNETLEIFENDINRLTEVTGIAKNKLIMIEKVLVEHRAIRDVIIFLQGHEISTLFAVRILCEP